MEQNEYIMAAAFFKSLGHKTRLMILFKLINGPQCVSNLGDLLKFTQPNISQHLSILRMNGIVDYYQEGNKKCYFLKNQKKIEALLEILKIE